jgi:hypothetical protein
MEEMLSSAKIFKEDLYKQLARIGKCLSNDKRLEILNVLSNGSKTVEKIAKSMKWSILQRSTMYIFSPGSTKITIGGINRLSHGGRLK